MSEKNKLLDWLGFKGTPDFVKSRALGGFVGFAITLFTIIVFAFALIGLAKALSLYAFTGSTEDPSAAIRNIGLLVVAIVALPLTVYRLKLTTEQNKHNENVLYNDKLHAANSDLHSRYQATEWKRKDGYVHVWKDDIIRRNGAIDRLEALAEEAVKMNQTEMVPRIARILCVYLKEMTAEHPAEKMPDGLDSVATYKWARDLKVKRSDMQTAAQVLGRLHGKTGVAAKDLAIDLSGVNLQAMTLSKLNFEHATLNSARLDGAQLIGAQLHKANLNGAKLNGAHLYGTKLNGAELHMAKLNGARLFGAYLNGAHLNRAELNGAELSGARLHAAILNGAKLNGAKLYGATLDGTELDGTELDENTELRGVHATGAALSSVNLEDVQNLHGLVKSAFGDASVKLPEDIKPLVKDKWPDTELDFMGYHKEWQRFQKDPKAYVPPQLRED